jgi:uncharacterized protein (DUF4213/DUF364 family)
MKEPLTHFYDKYGFDTSLIESIVCGDSYVLVMLKNGNIGVCATLNIKVEVSIKDMEAFDLNTTSHRIVANAYYNALLNYENKYDCEIDIFDKLAFEQYSQIVMVGFFRSLAKKFNEKKIPLHIFDKSTADIQLEDMSKQMEYISKANAVIVTSTSIFNSSFIEIIKNCNKSCDVFMLGPSTILHHDLVSYPNIKIVFGSVFENGDKRIAEVISKGGGTRDFLAYMKKVYLR